MENESALKSDRMLRIYLKLIQGEPFTKKELAQHFHVTERSIQRDLGALRCFLEDKSSFDNPDDLFPTIYRIDRIRSFKVLDEHFHVPYRDRFEEGEFRKRVQFMYGGKLEHIQFRYSGPSLEAVLDRLPTAKVIHSDDGGWTISAEVFGKGIEMWLRSHGSYIEKID